MTSPEPEGLLKELEEHAPSREHGEQYARDMEWLTSHRDELLEQYPEQWVAVYKEEVVAAHPRLDGMMLDLQARGLAGLNIASELITSHRVSMLL